MDIIVFLGNHPGAFLECCKQPNQYMFKEKPPSYFITMTLRERDQERSASGRFKQKNNSLNILIKNFKFWIIFYFILIILKYIFKEK